jgi:hypothetical protein
MFPDHSEEEIIYNFMRMPFEDISPLNLSKESKLNKKSQRIGISLNQKEGIDSLIHHDPHAIDDFDNPLMKHAAVFKIFLDKIYNGQEGKFPNNSAAFARERDLETDGLIE